MKQIIYTTVLMLASIMTTQANLTDSEISFDEETMFFNQLLERAENGDSYSQNYLGDYYQSSASRNRNLEQAAYWYEKSAESGNLNAAMSLGQLFSAGILGDEKKCEMAVYWYEKATKFNDPLAWANIAWQLTTCDNKAFRDGEKALKIMKEHGNKTGNISGVIDTMAAIYAELGNFKKAIALQETAIFLLEKNGNKLRLKSHKNRLGLYKLNKAFYGFAHENPEEFIE